MHDGLGSPLFAKATEEKRRPLFAKATEDELVVGLPPPCARATKDKWSSLLCQGYRERVGAEG